MEVSEESQQRFVTSASGLLWDLHCTASPTQKRAAGQKVSSQVGCSKRRRTRIHGLSVFKSANPSSRPLDIQPIYWNFRQAQMPSLIFGNLEGILNRYMNSPTVANLRPLKQIH